jgi:hypothetical protein
MTFTVVVLLGQWKTSLFTKGERAAKKEPAGIDGEKNLTANKKSSDAFRANFERLKARQGTTGEACPASYIERAINPLN